MAPMIAALALVTWTAESIPGFPVFPASQFETEGPERRPDVELWRKGWRFEEVTDGFTNNTCLIDRGLQPPSKGAPQTFLDECPAWVIRTTDEVWNLGPENRNKSIEKYFHPNFSSHYSFGRSYTGIPALKETVAATVNAFPDLKIYVTDCFCVGNDVDGYKTVMPDVLMGTNLGPSVYGPPTGKSFAYGGIAVTYVNRNPDTKEWQYVAEWIQHDELSLVSQLGLNLQQVSFPPTHAEPNRECDVNRPSWGGQAQGSLPPKFIGPNTKFDSDEDLPLAKALVKGMDSLISNHVDCWDFGPWSSAMRPYWNPDLIYDTNWTPFPDILGNSSGLRNWFDREHIPFNLAFRNCTFSQLIFAGEELTATTTTYGLAYWQADLAHIPHTSKPTRIRIFDFYKVDPKTKKIAYNWMLLDLVHLMLEAGFRVLPKPKLPEGWVAPPRAMDGIPAPVSSLVAEKDKEIARKVVFGGLMSDWMHRKLICHGLWKQDMVWYGPVGIGMAKGCQEYHDYFLRPFHLAFNGTNTLKIDVFSCEGPYCGVHGQFTGRHVGKWLGAEPTGRLIKLRFGMHYRVDTESHEIAESWALFDLPHAFHQMGINLFERLKAPRGA
eukprot:CAMPEP_0184496328 /NCGR_PEP_ID=MMETSP0113_2-20130426/33647_1 /TAXON_ID=91329 /ORGANISM="Norrisiella sphaerica, Strain BC52" /LENGTH=606 /DNA_ID=CAMNT_0026882901 /DNA_START=83 /DNA_END=1903 /DNA_ORIENTATION=+